MSEAIKLSMEVIEKIKKINLFAEPPRHMDSIKMMPLIEVFLNDFGMYLIMIADADHHINPVNPAEAKYIIDVARIRMNVDTMVYVKDAYGLGRGGKYRDMIPSSFSAIVERRLLPVKDICRLYAMAAMELIEVDNIANNDELTAFEDYRKLILEYLQTHVSDDEYNECKKEFDYTQYLTERETNKGQSSILKSRNQAIEDIKNEYADVFMNCDIRANPENAGADNLTKVLSEDMKKYIVFLSMSDGLVSDSDRQFLKDSLDVDMSIEEINEYALENNISVSTFEKHVPEIFTMCVPYENLQRSMQQIWPNKRAKNMNIGTSEKLLMVYIKLGFAMHFYSDDSSGPDMNAYANFMKLLRDYLDVNLNKYTQTT